MENHILGQSWNQVNWTWLMNISVSSGLYTIQHNVLTVLIQFHLLVARLFLACELLLFKQRNWATEDQTEFLISNVFLPELVSP